MLEAGKVFGTMLVPVQKETLTYSIPGKVYHLTIETEGITDEKTCAEVLIKELYEKFKAKVHWIRITNGVIDMQLEGSPFAWASLIAFLPSILSLLGIVFVLVSIYNVIASIPSWAWALLAVGVGLIFIGPTIAKSLTR